MSVASLLPKRTPRSAIVALFAVGLVAAVAGPAFAHTSGVTHQESCSVAGVTTTVVTFDNDYPLTAVVSYRWGAGSSFSTVDLATRPASGPNPTVSLPAHAVGTLTYHVLWSDNYRQPQGTAESTLTVAALEGCVPTTTTSSTTTTTTGSTTTTTQAAATTTTTAPPVTTTTQAAVTTSSTLAPAAVVAATTTTTGATQVLGLTLTAPAPATAAPAAALPRTGSPIASTVSVGLIALLLGGLALRLARSTKKTPTV
jgi:hypothetical protein